MSITFTWSVNTLERTTADGGVTAVHYSVSGTDGTYNGGAYGSVGLNGEITVPYADLTEETCIGWVKAALGNEINETDEEGNERTAEERTALAVGQIEAAIAAQINEQAAPTRASGTPWS